jgi:hypothetical protein
MEAGRGAGLDDLRGRVTKNFHHQTWIKYGNQVTTWDGNLQQQHGYH